MTQSLISRAILAAACAAVVGVGAASAETVYPAAHDPSRAQPVEHAQSGAQRMAEAGTVDARTLMQTDTRVQTAPSYGRLPAETRDRFNSPRPEIAVDSKPEIEALQDPSAEARYAKQLQQARDREAIKERMGASDPADAAALGQETGPAKRATMLPGRVSGSTVLDTGLDTGASVDARTGALVGAPGPTVVEGVDGRPVLR